MNANELADYLLDHMHDGGMTDLVMGEAATILRQQQAEIEALKELLDRFGITVTLKKANENE